MTLPEGLLAAWVGDDLTGAAAVAETLAFAGLPAALFLDPPDAAALGRFPGLRGVGVATAARAEPPEWMDAHLPALLAWARGTGAPLVHYKACSTLDSGPRTGSIGRALELGLAATGADHAPMLFAAPEFGRFQAFGHLFASGPAGVHRLDRHPVMARHPVTPMGESDVCRHLGRQTALPLAALHRTALTPQGHAALVAEGARGVALDCAGKDDLAAAGALLWAAPGFVVGSQGVQTALLAHWRERGWIGQAPAPRRPSRVERVAVVSGSASTTTARQIARAEAAGWPVIPLDAASLFGPGAGAAVTAATEAALLALSRGRSPIVAAARGPDDPALRAARAAMAAAGLSRARGEARIGEALGAVLADLAATGLTRVVACGGDTSGRVARALGLQALEPLAWIAHGASLMRGRRADGTTIEIVLKGGQMGPEDLFARALGEPPEEAGDGGADPRAHAGTTTITQGERHETSHHAA